MAWHHSTCPFSPHNPGPELPTRHKSHKTVQAEVNTAAERNGDIAIELIPPGPEDDLDVNGLSLKETKKDNK